MNFFLILQCIICVLLVLMIILQKSSSDSITGINSEFSSNNFMSGNSMNNLTQKIILGLIIAFLITSLVLANLSTKRNKSIKSKILLQEKQSKEIEIKK